MQNVLFELQSIVSHPYTVNISGNDKMSSKFPISVYYCSKWTLLYYITQFVLCTGLHIYIKSMA